MSKEKKQGHFVKRNCHFVSAKGRRLVSTFTFVYAGRDEEGGTRRERVTHLRLFFTIRKIKQRQHSLFLPPPYNTTAKNTKNFAPTHTRAPFR